MRAIFLVGAVLVSAVCPIGCHANPDIDGKTVAAVGSESAPPDCSAICNRLVGLCGYAPVDCTNTDKTGYCDTQLTDDETRVCMGSVETDSCQAAWDCVANATPVDSADAGDDDATADDASSDEDAAPQVGD